MSMETIKQNEYSQHIYPKGVGHADHKYEVHCHVCIWENKNGDSKGSRPSGLMFEFPRFQNLLHGKILMHAIGATNAFNLAAEPGYNRVRSGREGRLAGDYHLGALKKQLGPEEIQQELKQNCPPKNTGKEEDCQQWVRNALKHMHDLGWIDDQQLSNGLEHLDIFIEGAPDGEFKGDSWREHVAQHTGLEGVVRHWEHRNQ